MLRGITDPKIVETKLWGYLEPFWHLQDRYGLPWNKPEVWIGSGERNDISLKGEKISEHHCVLTWDGARSAFLRDVSSYGTILNEHRVVYDQSFRLCDGDELSIAQYKYIFRMVAGRANIVGSPHKPQSQALFSSTSSASSLTIPESLASIYSVEATLGAGTSGIVRLARHVNTGAYHALKMINTKTGGYNSTTVVRQVTDEVKNLVKLEHRHVCRIFGSVYDVDSGILTMILEYMPGGNLMTYIYTKYRQGMPEVVAKGIVYQLCDGVAYIHSKGIMHRDLKPDNVLLTKDDPPKVKIADFGISTKSEKLNGRHSICGTAHYIAPEVAGNAPYDDRADNFSVGVIMHVMLTGYGPFTTDKYRDNKDYFLNAHLVKHFRLETHVKERRLDLSGLQKLHLSGRVCRIVSSLLTEKPEDRRSMQAVLQTQWFDDYTPIYGRSAYAPTPNSRPSASATRSASLPVPIQAPRTKQAEKQRSHDEHHHNYTGGVPPVYIVDPAQYAVYAQGYYAVYLPPRPYPQVVQQPMVEVGTRGGVVTGSPGNRKAKHSHKPVIVQPQPHFQERRH